MLPRAVLPLSLSQLRAGGGVLVPARTRRKRAPDRSAPVPLAGAVEGRPAAREVPPGLPPELLPPPPPPSLLCRIRGTSCSAGTRHAPRRRRRRRQRRRRRDATRGQDPSLSSRQRGDSPLPPLPPPSHRPHTAGTEVHTEVPLCPTAAKARAAGGVARLAHRRGARRQLQLRARQGRLARARCRQARRRRR